MAATSTPTDSNKLMSEPTEIKIRDDGPIKVTGDFVVVDGEGNVLRESDGKPIALCRCGHSSDKPFCDGKHNDEGFSSCVRS